MAVKLEIFNNEGWIVKRAINYMKASWDNYTVVVKDLVNQVSWEYDQYHDTLENGHYVLFFMDKDGKPDTARHEIEVTDQSPETIYIVFSYHKILMLLDVKEKTEQEMREMAGKKRLGRPEGYRGY